MKIFQAAVKDNKTGEVTTIESEYRNKKEFRRDLNKNGYSVIGRVEDKSEYNIRKSAYDRGWKW